MKKIALISTFCDTFEKQELLRKNIGRIKDLSTDIMVISPIKIPYEIIEMCDYFISVKENPILPLDTRSQLLWKYPNSSHNIRHTLISKDYGWTSLYQIKKLLEISNNLDYDIFYLMIYDLKIDQEIEKIFIDNEVNYFFPNTRENPGNGSYRVGGVFGIFDKKNCKKIFSSINLDDYLKYFAAEHYYNSIQEELEIPIHSKVTTDLIYNKDSSHLFDLSTSTKVKIFIDNNNHSEHRGDGNFGIHLYDISSPVHVKISINGREYDNTISSEKIFLNPDPPQEVLDFQIEIDGEKIEIFSGDSDIKSEIKINDNNEWEFIRNYSHLNNLNF